MTIEVMHVNGTNTYIDFVKNYDFYPETKMLFVDCDDNESVYIPINENVKRIAIRGGAERGYLEGRDETC